LGLCESGETRHSSRCRLLCMWSIFFPERQDPRSHCPGGPARRNPSRGVRSGQQHRARRSEDRKKASAFPGSSWDRTHRLIYSKWSFCALGRPVREPTRIGGGMRRARPMGLQDRRVSHLRMRNSERPDPIRARATGSTRLGQSFDLLLKAGNTHRFGPLVPSLQHRATEWREVTACE